MFDLVREVVASLEIETPCRKGSMSESRCRAMRSATTQDRQISATPDSGESDLRMRSSSAKPPDRILVFSLSVVHRNGGVQWMIDVADTGIGARRIEHPSYPLSHSHRRTLRSREPSGCRPRSCSPSSTGRATGREPRVAAGKLRRDAGNHVSTNLERIPLIYGPGILSYKQNRIPRRRAHGPSHPPRGG